MAKKILFICIWTLVFFFGSAVLLGFASGFYLMISNSLGQPPSQTTTARIGMSWVLVPTVLGPIGFVLGVLGCLPGTRRRNPMKVSVREKRHASSSH